MSYKSILLIFICAFVSFSSKGEINEKFIKSCTEEVWSMDLPDFNAATVIPDSISKDHSAVIIADFILLEGDFNQNSSYAKAYNLGNSMTNITSRKYVSRSMVKLLDESAVEQFSQVDIGAGDKVRINTYDLAKQLQGFGARIHKPDGSVIDVDVMKSLAVTKGKKGKDDVEYKLQIPGLAVGDVLEYFIYIYDEIDELSLKPKRIDIIQRYPIMSYEFRGIFDPQLTVEYRTVNDAPRMETAYDSKGNLTASIRFENLPARPTSRYFLKSRQLPFYRFSILNNHTEMTWRPKISRRPGLYPDIEAGTYYREIGEVLTKIEPDETLVKLTDKYMKSYMKAHPDEPRRDLIDRAWVATMYYYLTDKKVSGSDLTVAKSFREVLRKLKLDDEKTAVGFVNSRETFPTDKLLSYSDVDYITVVDGLPYSLIDFDECAPGEFPGPFQGETGGMFCSDFRDPKAIINPVIYTVPTTNFNKNVLYSEVKLDINLDDEEMPVDFQRMVSASGTTKGEIGLVVTIAVLAAQMEDFLGIPESSRYSASASEKKDSDETFEDFLMSDAETMMGVRPTKINEKNLVNIGCLPNAKKMNYNLSGTIDGIVTDAGDGELLVNIGRLFGKNTKLLGSDRQSEYDAFVYSPYQCVYKVDLNIPQGYKVDKEAVEALSENVKNPLGCFTVSVNVADDGSMVTFNVIERNVVYMVPSDHWNELLELLDAAANFNETSIVLSPL